MRLSKISLFLLGSLISVLSASAAASGPPYGAYEVVAGDSLWKIAARADVLGSPWKWPLLFNANRDRITDPDHIQIGQRFLVPLAPTAGEVQVAMEMARQYMENGDNAPELSGPALVDEAPGADEPVPIDAGSIFRTLMIVSLGLWIVLMLLAYAVMPLLLLGRTQSLEPVLGQPAHPEPTESEAILRAMDGSDPLRHPAVEAEHEEPHELAA